MKLTVISTGSAGNSYLLTSSKGDTLILEVGVKFVEIKKALKFNLQKVVGALCSHSHQDHCKGVKELTAAGIDVYTLKATSDSFGFDNHRINNIEANKQFSLGEFKVIPFHVKHDVPCLGFLIHHPECGKLLFVTDTYMLTNRFSGLNNILIEANYCQNILQERLDAGSIHSFLNDRVIRSHMSLENCKGVLRANDLTSVHKVILIHLSDRNSDADRFKKEIQELTGKTVEVATKGLITNIDITPW